MSGRGDTISRAAAIKAIKDALLAWSCMPSWRDDKIVEVIVDLPSAQPEIIRCKDCRYTDEDGVCQSSKGLAIQDDDDFCSHAERREE